MYVAGPQPPQQPGAPPQQGQQQNPQQGGPQSLPLSISGATAPLVSYPIMTQDLRPVLQTSLSHWSPCLFCLVCVFTVFSGLQKDFFFFLVCNTAVTPGAQYSHFSVNRLRLLLHGPLCGQATSIWTRHSRGLAGHTALISHTLVLLHAYTFQQGRQSLSLMVGIAVTCVVALIRLCVTPVAQPQGSVPAAGMERCHLASVVVSSERFHEIQWRCSFWSLSGLCESRLKHFSNRKATLSDVL